MDTPFGEVLSTDGSGNTSYGYTGEWTDSTGMVYLRARYYAPWQGRFISRDTWGGDYNRPLSLNRWNYVEGNPINRIDPTGKYTILCGGNSFDIMGVTKRVNFAERLMSKKSRTKDPTDPLNTYVAAGIAIQCSGTSSLSEK